MSTFDTLFPRLRGKNFAEANLNIAAVNFFLDQGKAFPKPSPFLNAAYCKDFAQKLAGSLSADFTYGGYLEERSDLWAGSYLDKWVRHVHLGVDFNVPVGTLVAAPVDMDIMHIDNDTPEEHGWGGRVIARLLHTPYVMIFAHLGQVTCSPGTRLRKGNSIGYVGESTENGGWYPHLHVQAINLHLYETTELLKIDGYARSRNISELMRLYPYPLPLLELA